MTLNTSTNVKKPQKWLTLAVFLVAAWGLNAGALGQSAYKDSRIQALGQTFVAPEPVVAQQARLIFYRTAQSSAVPGAASIYVNGAYHASLVAGAYSQLCMPVGEIELGLKSVEVGRTVPDKLDTVTIARSQAAHTHYFLVKQVGAQRQVLSAVPPEQALMEIKGAKEQIHTISRVPEASECIAQRAKPQAPTAVASAQTITLAADALFASAAAGAGAGTAPNAAVPSAALAQRAAGQASQTLSLAADAPFAFGRSDMDAISPSGRASLNELAKRLASDYSQIDSLHVVGHADPIGRAGLNERLSVKRAQTVRDYLHQAGLHHVQITSDGKGSRELVVTHCDTVPTPEAISCHAPNRRVVIDIVGTRR